MSTEKFQGQYRIASARLQSWDYGWDGAYFVTICTESKIPFLGKIIKNEMALSPIGRIAQQCWQSIPDHSHHITLGSYVVMPNHIHGILVFDEKNWEDGLQDGKDKACSKNRKDKACLVSTGDAIDRDVGAERRRNQGSNTLSSIIGSYKSAVSKHAHRQNSNFAWQPRFHDHIIRAEQSHEHIANYILTNPQNWEKDTFFVAQK